MPIGTSHSNILPPPIAPIREPDNQQASSWPALLRATELAREADLQNARPAGGRRKGGSEDAS